MKIAILGDLHFICPDDPITARVDRACFENTETYFQKQKEYIQKENVDLVISLGDLVDWYSDINRDYAIDHMDSIGIPWKMVAGNHDFQMYPDLSQEVPVHTKPADTRHICTESWLKKGIELHDRIIETDGADLLLLENGPSKTLTTTQTWLKEVLEYRENISLFTHVPLDTPEIRAYITKKSPQRALSKYVCSGSPWLYYDIRDKVNHVFTGHLHFAGELKAGITEMHLIPLGCYSSIGHNREMGRITFYDTCSNRIDSINLPA
jgi:predicted phosphodiesterase